MLSYCSWNERHNINTMDSVNMNSTTNISALEGSSGQFPDEWETARSIFLPGISLLLPLGTVGNILYLNYNAEGKFKEDLNMFLPVSSSSGWYGWVINCLSETFFKNRLRYFNRWTFPLVESIIHYWLLWVVTPHNARSVYWPVN